MSTISATSGLSRTHNDVSTLNTFQLYYFNFKRFHSNLSNVIIHCLFTPPVFASASYLLTLLGLYFDFTMFNLGYLGWILLTPFLVYIDWFSGLLTIIQYVLIEFFVSANVNKIFSCFNSNLNVAYLMGAIFVISFIILQLGHVIEKRGQGVTESIRDSIAVCLMVNINALFYFVSYRKQEILDIDHLIRRDIADYKRNSQKTN